MSADAALLSAPLLDRAELVALIRLGESLARRLPSRRTAGGRHGGEPARRLGEGMDFAEHRPYQPGDDPRRINWRLSARHDTPQVRRYHEDVTAPFVVLLDRRASLRFGTRKRLKLTQAVRLTMVLSGLHAARQADIRVVEIDCSDHVLPPTGSRGLLALGQHLAAPSPPSHGTEPSLPDALRDLEGHMPGGAHLTVISDFADAEAVSPQQWHRLAMRHRVDLVCIEDPAENQPPSSPGGATLCWPSAGEAMLDRTIAAQLTEHHHRRLARLQADIGGSGIRLLRLPGDRDDLLTTVQDLLR